MKAIKRLPESFGIRFGITAPTIPAQIRDQKLKFEYDEAQKFEKSRQAIFTLRYTDMISDGQADKLYQKLYNKILRHLGKVNGCRVKP